MPEIAQGLYVGRVVLLLTIALASCSYQNDPLPKWDPNTGYREALFQSRTEEKAQRGHLQQLWLSMNLSGGGTRAAAFAYGVLEELADTEVRVDEQPQFLLQKANIYNEAPSGDRLH